MSNVKPGVRAQKRRFRRTPQRLAIIDFLKSHPTHPSAEDVYEGVRRKFPTLSLATVYNTLEALRGRGEVIELGFDPGKKRFDAVAETHHHLVCVRCRRVVDIPKKFDPVLADREKMGYQVIRSQVDFHGLCPRCQRPKTQKP